jgi:hypothetical protein
MNTTTPLKKERKTTETERSKNREKPIIAHRTSTLRIVETLNLLAHSQPKKSQNCTSCPLELNRTSLNCQSTPSQNPPKIVTGTVAQRGGGLAFGRGFTKARTGGELPK